MAATLPELETVTLRRGASNGAELRIELNRPERMNAWDKQLGVDLLAAVELAAGDDGVRAVTITGAGRAFSSGADLRAGFDPTPERPARRRHGAARALPPDHHRRAADAQAGARRRQRAGGRDRLLARARLRPRARRRVGLLPARVRQHRPRARRRLVGLRPGARRRRARGRDGAAGRARAGRARARAWGLVDRLVADDVVRRRGRRARRAARDRPDARLRGAPRSSSTRACTRGSTSSSSWRRRCSRSWPDRRTSARACWPSWRSARRGSPASERSRPDQSIHCAARWTGPAFRPSLRRALAPALLALLVTAAPAPARG